MLDFESLTSGAPVPPVNPDDVKHVWRFIWEAVSGRPATEGEASAPAIGFDAGLIAQQCSSGADVFAFSSEPPCFSHCCGKECLMTGGKAMNSAMPYLVLPRPFRCKMASRASTPRLSSSDCAPAQPSRHWAAQAQGQQAARLWYGRRLEPHGSGVGSPRPGQWSDAPVQRALPGAGRAGFACAGDSCPRPVDTGGD